MLPPQAPLIHKSEWIPMTRTMAVSQNDKYGSTYFPNFQLVWVFSWS